MKRKLFLLLCSLLTSVGMWADVDYVRSFSNAAWEGNEGAQKNTFPRKNSVNMGECYYTSLATGFAMKQKVVDLPNGTYEVEIYANACHANGVGGDFVASNNTLTVNGVDQTVATVENSSVEELPMDVYTFSNVSVTDGTMTITFNRDENGANWFTASVKSVVYKGTSEYTDYTNSITNPSFETSGGSGWTSTGKLTLNYNQSNSSFLTNGAKYAEYWQPNGIIDIKQVVKVLKNGRYKLGVDAYARSTTSAKFYTDNDKSVDISERNRYNLTILAKKDDNVTIGVNAEGTGISASWFACDNFTLEYFGNDISYYSLTSFDGDDEATKDTWYAFTVSATGWYRISSTAEATIYYSQDASEDADKTASKAFTADGYAFQNLTAGTYYFKSSAASTIKIEAVSSETLQNGDVVTEMFIANPSFEAAVSDKDAIVEWGGNGLQSYLARTSGLSNKVGSFCAGSTGFNTSRDLNQTMSNLPTGIYVMTVNADAAGNVTAYGSDSGNPSFYVGSSTIAVPSILPAYTYNIALNESANESAFGVKAKGHGTGTSFYFDNFTLTYYETLPDVSITDLTSSAMSADVRAALDAANTAYTGSKTVANYNALQTAIVNAKVSIADFAGRTGADADWTGVITNPSFETGTPNYYKGWTVEVSSGSSTSDDQHRYKADGMGGEGAGDWRFFIWTANAGAATVKQTLNELPSGNYKLSAYMASGAGDVFTLSAGSTFGKVIASDGNATLVETYFTQASKGNIEISATHSSSWFDLDNFHLTFDPTLPESITGVSGNMNSTVASAQTTAVNAYNAVDGQTFANMLAAQTEMNNARASILVYNDISNLVTTYAERVQNNLDAAGQAAYDASTVEGKITSGTYATAAEAEADLKAAYITAVKAQTTPGADMTEAITNPSFESATGVSTSIAGWTNEANKTLQTQSNKGPGDTFRVGNYYAERWHSTGDKNIYQLITGLHAGAYVLTAKAYAGDATAKVYAMVGETEHAIDVTATEDYSVLFDYDGTSDLKIGFSANMGNDANTGWICVDNFRLTYAGETQPNLSLYTTEPMNATAKANANTAINNYNANKTSENYTAAESAIAVAEASKTAYNRASLEGYKSRMGELLAKTNVYTEAAYNKWYANVDDYYADGEYTDEEVVTLTAAGACQGATEDTHKKANRIDDVLLSTWTIGGEQCSDYDKSLYINTWSLEGNNDGSGFQTPFFEYWTSDGNSLGEASLSATMTGLEASTSYSIEMWARVRQTDNQTKVADKIMLKVGSGDAVDIAAGAQHTTHGTSNFYNGHFTATGSTDESGNLTITIAVAANSNVSWLSFKDVAVSKQATIGDVQTYSGLINNDTELVPTAAAPIVNITEASFNGALTANFSSNDNGFIIATAEQKAALGDIKNVVVGNTCDKLVLTDGVKAVIPAALTQATSATYSRTIAAASNYGTICLPYAVKSDDDIQYYTVNQIVGNVLKLNEVAGVAAGTPAIFKKKNGGATNITAAASNVPVTDDAGVEASLVGTFERLAVGDEGSSSGTAANKYYYIKNNEFVRGLDYFYINPFRAYIDTNDSSETPARLVIDTDSETAINELKTLDEKQGLKDGKYLIGGKVIVVKAGKQFNVNGVLK